MPRQRLPHIGSSGNKTVKPPVSSAQRPHQSRVRKRSQPQSSALVSDSTMTPWGGLQLSESSFTTISPPRPPSAPPPPPPAPQPTPTSPYQAKQQQTSSTSTINSNGLTPSPETAPEGTGGGVVHSFHSKRRPLPQRRVARPPRLPPLRQVTNLSFSRSFTFSFFELPLYQSPHCRAERTKNLLLLLKKVHY